MKFPHSLSVSLLSKFLLMFVFDKLLCCQTADFTADLNLYFVLKGHVPASLFAIADYI